MIKNTILIITTFLISTSISLAASEDMKGTYTGEETLTVFDCKHKAVLKGAVTLNIIEVKGDTFKGNGSNMDSKFTFKGDIKGDQLTSRAKGKNKWGQNWDSTTEGALKGDVYTYSVKGMVLAPPNCKFTSDVKVLRK